MRIVAFFMIFCLFVACNEPQGVPDKNSDNVVVEIKPDQVSHDVKVLFYDSSFKKAVLSNS